jgi:hypothetical protein
VEKSEQINELSTALSLAQFEMGNAAKDSKNPFFNSKYADLAEIINTVKASFGNHGLSYSQHPSYNNGDVLLTTIIMHKSGQWMSSCMSMPVVKKDPQGVGSAVTYCRRYSLASICGITQEDDDGNDASNTGKDNYRKGFDDLKENHKGKDTRTDREKNNAILDNDDIPDYGKNQPKQQAQSPKPIELGEPPELVECVPDTFCKMMPKFKKFENKKFTGMSSDELSEVYIVLGEIESKVKTDNGKKWVEVTKSSIRKATEIINNQPHVETV